jgi:hypothetical protein
MIYNFEMVNSTFVYKMMMHWDKIPKLQSLLSHGIHSHHNVRFLKNFLFEDKWVLFSALPQKKKKKKDQPMSFIKNKIKIKI